MRKATLSKNTLLKNKFRFFVSGLPEANRVLSVGSIENEIGVIERPDKTKVSGGRTSGGSTDIALEFADTQTIDGYLAWYKAAQDRASDGRGDLIGADQLNGAIIGIQADYKREANLVYHRQYASQAATEQPRTITLQGCWLNKFSIDEANIDTEEHQVVTMSMNYDDADIIV